jgi:hypothetical protein
MPSCTNTSPYTIRINPNARHLINKTYYVSPQAPTDNHPSPPLPYLPMPLPDISNMSIVRHLRAFDHLRWWQIYCVVCAVAGSTAFIVVGRGKRSL